MDLNTTLAEINTLPVEDRIRLAQAIWDAIPEADCAPDLTSDHEAELDRRLAELEADPSIAVTWDDIKSRLGRGP